MQSVNFLMQFAPLEVLAGLSPSDRAGIHENSAMLIAHATQTLEQGLLSTGWVYQRVEGTPERQTLYYADGTGRFRTIQISKYIMPPETGPKRDPLLWHVLLASHRGPPCADGL